MAEIFKKSVLFALSAILLCGCMWLSACEPPPRTTPDEFEGMRMEGYTPAFRDEFDDGELDPEKWEHEESGFWYNNEVQYYDGDHTTVSDGTLKITARREPRDFIRNGQTVTKEFGSSRLRTKNRFAQTYGRFEASIKMPAVSGLWPAFWMLPEEDYYGGWPHSGEIDIMETRGHIPEVYGTTVHYSAQNGNHAFSGEEWTFPDGGRIDDFHSYAVEWTENEMRWYLDGELNYTVNVDKWSTGGKENGRPALKTENPAAPFDRPFHMLLNLAVGGDYIGGRLPANDFTEAAMEIDYVRVWRINE